MKYFSIKIKIKAIEECFLAGVVMVGEKGFAKFLSGEAFYE